MSTGARWTKKVLFGTASIEDDYLLGRSKKSQITLIEGSGKGYDQIFTQANP